MSDFTYNGKRYKVNESAIKDYIENCKSEEEKAFVQSFVKYMTDNHPVEGKRKETLESVMNRLSGMQEESTVLNGVLEPRTVGEVYCSMSPKKKSAVHALASAMTVINVCGYRCSDIYRSMSEEEKSVTAYIMLDHLQQY